MALGFSIFFGLTLFYLFVKVFMPLVFNFISNKHAVYKTYSITKKIIKWGLIYFLVFFIIFYIFLGGNPNSDFYIRSVIGEWWLGEWWLLECLKSHNYLMTMFCEWWLGGWWFEDTFSIVLLLVCCFCMFCLLFFWKE